MCGVNKGQRGVTTFRGKNMSYGIPPPIFFTVQLGGKGDQMGNVARAFEKKGGGRGIKRGWLTVLSDCERAGVLR